MFKAFNINSFYKLILIFFGIFFIPFHSFNQIPLYNYKAYQRGEILEYNIHYGIINAGKITMKVDNNYVELYNQRLLQLNTSGLTYAGWDLFFKVRDYYTSYIDTNTLYPVYLCC